MIESISQLLDTLAPTLEKNFSVSRYGDIPRWQEALDALPEVKPSTIDLSNDTIIIGAQEDLSEQQHTNLIKGLKGLHPWRKGPFNFFGTHIDTEWRSDFKWNRVLPYIESLEGKTVLDVGCGSGYHCWRMRNCGAQTVLGIDPGPLFIMQYRAAQKYIQDNSVEVIPLKMEELPDNLALFDTVFSMGILYHRRSPMDHLLELKQALKPGGQLILETLVIDGSLGEVLMPEGRYSKMGNVWFIPSPATLELWLKKMGFSNITCVDINTTSPDEQRSTEWMQFQSLKDFLDPKDSSRTIEGYPAPIRAVFTAEKSQ